MAKKNRIETSIVPVEVVQKAESDAALAIKQAEAIQVKTIEQEESAHDVLRDIKQAIKTIEDKRKEITKPLNASLKAANDLFKKLSLPFTTADRIIRDKVMEFHRIEEAKAQKKFEMKQRVQDKREEKGLERKEVAPVEAKVSTQTVTAKRWTFEIIDATKIPREYLILDSSLVREAIRKGVREIDGIEIFQVEGLRV